MWVLKLETTGLPKADLPLDDHSQPRVLRVVSLLADAEGAAATLDVHCQPEEGWRLSPLAEEVHGISRRRAVLLGVPVRCAVAMASQMSRKARTAVAWFAPFERQVIASQIARLGGDPAQTVARPGLSWVSVGELCAQPCGLVDEEKAPRSPKLHEAVRILLGLDLPEDRSTHAEALAVHSLYRHLEGRGLLA